MRQLCARGCRPPLRERPPTLAPTHPLAAAAPRRAASSSGAWHKAGVSVELPGAEDVRVEDVM